MRKLHHRALRALSPVVIANSFTTRLLYKNFADSHGLVYFGTVDRQDDEYRLVKGITVSTSHADNHYCVGSFGGRDLILLERQDSLKLPNDKKTEHLTWTILQVDLRPTEHLAHSFLDGHHHTNTFYNAAFAKLGRLTEITEHHFSTYDPLFMQHFTAHTSPEAMEQFSKLITPGTAAVLAHHFTAFDFEWQDDTLLVYLLTKKPTAQSLDYLLRAGVWLANELEAPESLNSFEP